MSISRLQSMTVKESELFGCIARENAINSVANRWHSRRASNSNDRGIAIDRIGVENRFWRLGGKFVRAPKIAVRQFRSANVEQTQCKFRSLLSISIDRGIDIDRISVETSILAPTCMEKKRGAPSKVCSGPEDHGALISFRKR